MDVAAPLVHALKVTAPPTVTAGDAFSVTVAAVTAQGDPVTSYSGTVHFSSSDTSSAVVLPADSALANGQGTFSVTLASAGSQTLIATDTTTATIVGQVTVGVSAAAASRLALSTTATPTAGTSFSFTVKAFDRFGNTATGYAGRVHFTSSDGAATLPPDSTLTDGRATLAATLTRAGSQTITGTDAASLSGQLAVTVRAAPAVRLVLAGAQTATAGEAFAFTVEARDQFGNVDAAYVGRVHFASSDGSTGVVLPGDSTLTNGRGTFSATLTKAGTQTISGTDIAKATITGKLSIAVVAAGAAALSLDSPSSTTVGGTFTVKVTLRDQFGNVATGYRGAVHFSTSDPLPTVMLPGDYTFTASDAGSHTFSVQLWTPGNQTLTARDKSKSTLSDTNSITVRLLLL